MRKFLGVLAAAAVLMPTYASALQADQMYVSGGVSYKIGDYVWKKGTNLNGSAEEQKQDIKRFGFNFGMGWNVSENMRFEGLVEYSGDKYKLPEGVRTAVTGAEDKDAINSSNISGMVNGYLHIGSATVSPYVMVGVGMGYGMLSGIKDVKLSTATTNAEATFKDTKSITEFLWNVGAGVSLEIQQGISFDLGYKFGNFTSAKLEQKINTKDANTNTTLSMEPSNIHAVFGGLRISF